MTLRLLAIDTATEACSAALWIDGAIVERHEVVGRTHTERLLPLVQALLADAGLRPAQLDGLIAGIGPGSFAGVRIGVGLVKGMALGLDRPVVGITSLAMLAQAALDQGAERVLPCIDARMSEIYWGAYGRDAAGLASPLCADQVVPPGAVDFSALPGGDWSAVGTGWGTYADVLTPRLPHRLLSVDGAALPRARHALTLAQPVFASGAAGSADDLAPAYLRDRVALTLVEQQAARAARSSG